MCIFETGEQMSSLPERGSTKRGNQLEDSTDGTKRWNSRVSLTNIRTTEWLNVCNRDYGPCRLRKEEASCSRTCGTRPCKIDCSLHNLLFLIAVFGFLIFCSEGSVLLDILCFIKSPQS